MSKKSIRPGEKVPLKLTATERKLILEEVTGLPSEYEAVLQSKPARQPVMMSLDDLDDFGGYIAAEANHTDDPKLEQKLDQIFGKVQTLLETHTDEPPNTLTVEDARTAKVLSEKAVEIAQWVAQVLVGAEQLGIKNKPLEDFWQSPAQRDVLLLVPGISKSIKGKLAKKGASFTLAEVAGMTMALVEDLPDGDARKQMAFLLVAQHLMDRLREGVGGPTKPEEDHTEKPKARASSTTVYQFKITLNDYEPTIWRRIQVKDCTLDKLHERIQTAMGWTNSHLHEFEIDGERYGDPELLNYGFEEFPGVDTTVTKISQIVPKDGKRFGFLYQYDFGDSWNHEVLFEGCLRAGSGQRYPLHRR